MNEINNTINTLLAQVKADDSKRYEANWTANAVNALNDYYEAKEYYDDRIYELESDEWEEVVKYNLDQRGWLGLKFLLDGIDNNAEYAQLDAYGNGRSVDYDLVDMLENAKEGY